jgi:hypothetical protein
MLREQERAANRRTHPIVRSLQLQAALAEFLAQAADRLQEDVLAGQEVPFELASHSARGRGPSPLYCYRPLTGVFISERLPELRRLDGYNNAAELLENFEGIERYLTSTGGEIRRGRYARGDAALLGLLNDVFDEQTDFDRSKTGRHEERLESALERLDGSLLALSTEVTLLATLHGLTIPSPELALTRGLLIAQPGALRGAPEQALGSGVRGEEDHLLVVFRTNETDPHLAIAKGREVMRELLRALRLFGDARVTLGALAWTRIDSGSRGGGRDRMWDTIAMGLGGRPYGMLLVRAEQEDELRAFCNLVSRRAPHENELAWALRRFELGCERDSEYEAISDYLMALRALLEPEGPASGLLAGRVAALCATPEARLSTTERILAAAKLERETIAGAPAERDAGLTLTRELSNHLRALLRDVICGHLPSDLVSLADELLLSEGELDRDEPHMLVQAS